MNSQDALLNNVEGEIELNGDINNYDENELINKALRCLEKRLSYGTQVFNCAKKVCDYLRLQLAQEKNEVFAVLFLDSKHSLLAFEKLFFGTINQAAVYPRVIVQKSFEHNASAIIIAHNHPSGNCTPSDADKEITNNLKTILNIVDINLLDHIIVSYQASYSFKQHKLL